MSGKDRTIRSKEARSFGGGTGRAQLSGIFQVAVWDAESRNHRRQRFGSEENYEYMFANSMTPYVKYNMFHVKQRRCYRNDPFRVSNLFYNPYSDFYVCPIGQKMKFARQEKRYTANGYEQTVSIYRATLCNGCLLRGQCNKSKRNRQIEVNHTLDDYKARVRELLTSEQGLKHRSRHPIEPEAVFGQIKECGKFRRLRLKGMTGAKIDFGLKAIAHNLSKLALVWAKFSFFSKLLFSRHKKGVI